MAQHKDLQLFRALAAPEQHDQLEQPADDDVHERRAQGRPPQDGLATLPRHQQARPTASAERPTEFVHPTREGQGEWERDVLAKIAEMPKADRALAERLHELIKAAAPTLSPKT